MLQCLDAGISSRIQSAAGAFSKLQNIGFCKITISLRLKTRIFKTCVLSRLLYGCETWALIQNLLHRLETFVLSCLQNILGMTVLDRLHSDIIGRILRHLR